MGLPAFEMVPSDLCLRACILGVPPAYVRGLPCETDSRVQTRRVGPPRLVITGIAFTQLCQSVHLSLTLMAPSQGSRPPRREDTKQPCGEVL